MNHQNFGGALRKACRLIGTKSLRPLSLSCVWLVAFRTRIADHFIGLRVPNAYVALLVACATAMLSIGCRPGGDPDRGTSRRDSNGLPSRSNSATASIAAGESRGSGRSSPDSNDAARSKHVPVFLNFLDQPDYQSADVRVLFVGNSHTRRHGLSQIVQELMELKEPDSGAFCLTSVGMGYLVDHANRPATIDLINEAEWDFVVLQAQKYSTTGRYSYPIDGALKLIRLARARGAEVIMFPEWPRRSHPEERERIENLHKRIARQAGARVALVGSAWENAIKQQPGIEQRLYAADGNHAALPGAYLTACVLYMEITGEDPRDVPRWEGGDLPEGEQQFLRRVAWETAQTSDPRSAAPRSAAPRSAAQ